MRLYMLNKIYYAKPSITDLEIRYVTDAVTTGWGDACYTYISKLEKMFCQYCGCKFALATSSATGALHLGMAALEIGPGDEVIIADTNWIASVAPIVHLGAKPVFVDILPDTWCLDPQRVREAITPRTKAIIAVHLYGNLCDIDELEVIANEHGLILIEDAAEAIGSHWNDRKAGTQGLFGVFSFHGTKTVTTGEGGLLVTNNSLLYEKASMLNNHGRAKGDKRQFWATIVGYKYKMSNIQAALGCAQMERITELIARRREIFFYYKKLLANNLQISMNPVPNEGTEYGYWMPTVVFSKACQLTQNTILEVFKRHNIDGRAFFSPLSGQASFAQNIFPTISADICSRAVNLPSYHDIKDEDQQRVANVLLEALDNEALHSLGRNRASKSIA